MGLFYEQPTRSAWVRTRTECEIAEMTYPRFRQIASESPGLVFELATQLATRLDRTNRKLGDLAFVDVTGRVAHAIMDLCNEPDAMTHPDGMQIKVSRQELSRLVGCSREMAGRVLKVLEEQGLVSASGKTPDQTGNYDVGARLAGDCIAEDKKAGLRRLFCRA
jgi:CRP/FNR family cyclic AMP-dependent transcriptional regulator